MTSFSAAAWALAVAWAAAAPTNLPTAAQFGSFVKAIVGRYHGTVHYWEMWNEPNYGFSGGGYLWPASVSDYVNDILNPGYAAAHAADATARLTETTAITFREYSNLLRELVGREPDDAEPPMEPELLSYLIAAALNLQVPEKQSLLAEPRTDARLVLELRMLRKEIVLLKQMVAHATTAAKVRPSLN